MRKINRQRNGNLKVEVRKADGSRSHRPNSTIPFLSLWYLCLKGGAIVSFKAIHLCVEMIVDELRATEQNKSKPPVKNHE